MNEDIEIVNFIKGRLEGDVRKEPPHFEEIMRAASEASFAAAAERRAHRRLWMSSLAAACVAVVCSFAVMHRQCSSPAPEVTVAYVIDLLRAADGTESAQEEPSVEEMLLAWQDAPYESAVSGIVADN